MTESDSNFKKVRQRKNILREIIATEKTYVNGLKSLIDNFMSPLQQGQSGVPTLTPLEIQSIFGNVNAIFAFHHLLLQQLEKEWKDCGSSMNIASLISKQFPFLKMYIPYINNFQLSLQTLTKCKQISKFRKWLESIEKKTGDLPSLLILCVQRVPRYVKILLNSF